MSGIKTKLKNLWQLKSWIVLVVAVLAPLSLVTEVDNKQSRCAYVIIIMAALWLTEAIPIPVTALLPIFMFPMLQVAEAKTISGAYVTDTSMLFLGGLILAVAVEEWNLHRRIAVSVMRVIGAHPSMLMLGLMLPTWFLSMWISNTAATSMMIPIIQAVVHTLEDVHMHSYSDKGQHNPSFQMDEQISTIDTPTTKTPKTNLSTPTKVPKNKHNVTLLHVYNLDMTFPLENGTTENGNAAHVGPDEIDGTNDAVSEHHVDVSDETSADGSVVSSDDPVVNTARRQSVKSLSTASRELHRLAKGLALSVAYAANVGGIATLTGTPPNLVLKNNADEFYQNESQNAVKESPISFTTWMGFAFPLSLLTLALSWVWLQVFFLRCSCFRKTDEQSKKAVNAVIKRQFKALGFITFAEAMVLFVFCVIVALWLFRDPPNIDGWGRGFYDAVDKLKYVSDSTPAILISVSLFFLPAKVPNIFCWAQDEEKPSYTPLLTWNKVEKRVSWGVILLLGGGFAIAKASKDSGLSKTLGENLKVFASYDPWVMNLIFSLIVAAATEVTSNTAMATLLMPILAQVAVSFVVHRLYLMTSVTVVFVCLVATAGHEAVSIGVHPLYLMISATVACSFAFMLPVATPPNAIVFSTGYLRIPDMACTGLPMNIIAVLCLTLAVNTWGKSMYGFDDIPEFFQRNVTTT